MLGRVAGTSGGHQAVQPLLDRTRIGCGTAVAVQLGTDTETASMQVLDYPDVPGCCASPDQAARRFALGDLTV
ncbi:MAG: hypothetical protein JO345_20715 [Streptosporangiaceae bacterium]|nr:hypothetical protein [Streptosporangiaceae bacterium]